MSGFDGAALPLLIFVAEMFVVTVCTVRIISLSRGMKYTAALLGLVEITVWLFAIGQVMKNLNNLGCSLSFAVGFALGNYLGVLIDQKLALGFQVVRVITARDPAELVQALKAAGYGVTSIDGRGGTGPVRIVFSVIPRREFENVLTLLRRFDPNVFYSVDCLHTAAAGVFPLTRGRTSTTMRSWRGAGTGYDTPSSAAA